MPYDTTEIPQSTIDAILRLTKGDDYHLGGVFNVLMNLASADATGSVLTTGPVSTWGTTEGVLMGIGSGEVKIEWQISMSEGTLADPFSSTSWSAASTLTTKTLSSSIPFVVDVTHKPYPFVRFVLTPTTTMYGRIVYINRRLIPGLKTRVLTEG
jgi:hypothetical protein